MKNQLIVFLKAPLIGKAKTRLAADIGYVHAQRLYKAMTAELLKNVRSSQWETTLAITPDKWLGRVPAWNNFPQYAQVNGSLSPRLAQAFSKKGKTVVIGSDCPQITKQDIASAFKYMRPDRPVFGPADDGGFWLIAAAGPIAPEVFENVRWSTEYALKDMAGHMGHKPHYLRTLTDVDDLAALRSVRAKQPD